MGSELIDNVAEGLMGYWLRGHEGKRNSCCSEVQLVGQKISRQNFFSANFATRWLLLIDL